MKVQYGCGWDAPLSWLNFDASPTVLLERVPFLNRIYVKNDAPFPKNVRHGNIVKGLPIPSASCTLLYCSHVLEHLSLEDFYRATTESFRILQPGGVWRLVMPDLRLEAERYLQSNRPGAAIDFVQRSGMGQEHRATSIGRRVYDSFGNSRHLWLWDYPSVADALHSAGFVEIRRAEFGDAEQPSYTEVERAERWEDALGIQCRRPL